MMSWVSLLLDAGLATLMVALIVYCIKLNRRLSLLRNQSAEFADMMTGLNEASARAEQSVQHLKAAGLSAEKSLRSVIAEAAVKQADLSRMAASAPQAAAPQAVPTPQQNTAPANRVPPVEAPRADNPEQPGRAKVQRDILIGDGGAPTETSEPAPPPAVRPKTRQEAEETVLQAIRSARVGT
jgi:hypothetical protein